MTTRDVAPKGAPNWCELFVTDEATAQAFYCDLFGWTVETNEEFGGYFNFSKDGVLVAGGMHNHGDGGPDGWNVYLAVDDAQATAAAAGAKGATTIVPPQEVAGLGTMEFFLDPGGASIGGWQPGTHKGFGVHQEPGTPDWFELHTSAFDASFAFYRDVFGWPIDLSMEEPFRYATYGSYDSDDALAGIMDASEWLPEGAPAQWSIYWGSADLDASLARVKELGGDVVGGPDDTPYGRLAECTDPTGVRFKLRQPPG